MYFKQLITLISVFFSLFFWLSANAALIKNNSYSSENDVNAEIPLGVTSSEDLDGKKEPSGSRTVVIPKNLLNNPTSPKFPTQQIYTNFQNTNTADIYDSILNYKGIPAINLMDSDKDQQTNLINLFVNFLSSKEQLKNILIESNDLVNLLSGNIDLFFQSLKQNNDSPDDLYDETGLNNQNIIQLVGTSSAIQALLFPTQYQYVTKINNGTYSSENSITRFNSKKTVISKTNDLSKKSENMNFLELETNASSIVPWLLSSAIILFFVGVKLRS